MSTITETRLRELLLSYGADPARWPAAEREPALALLQASAAARVLRDEAAALDAQLDLWEVPAPPPGLAARVLAGAPVPTAVRPSWLRRLWLELGGWRLAAPAFAASVALGALLPAWLEQVEDLPDEDLIAALELVDEPTEPTP